MVNAEKRYTQYKYKIAFTYLDIVKNSSYEITNECVKSIIIDHNYDVNSMPIMYANMKLDKKLVDDMILNINTNLMIVAIYKYDDLSEDKQEIEVIKDRFTYFLPDDVNTNDYMDYSEANQNEHMGNTYRDISLGLMSIKMINNNKKYLEINATNNSVYDCVRYCTSHIENLIIEPFTFNDIHGRIIMPPQESVRKALEYLNSYRVFYRTPFRFYQDFDCSYIISSSGNGINKANELFNSIIINIRDISEDDANDPGLIINNDTKVYEVPVSYANVSVYNNSISNKSQNKIVGITSTNNISADLINSADYSTDKTRRIRLNNDNVHMLSNLKVEADNKNMLVFFTKMDLDSSIFSINKKISIHHINKYQQYNGNYLLYRKRECFIRESDDFILDTMLNLKKAEQPEYISDDTSKPIVTKRIINIIR